MKSISRQTWIAAALLYAAVALVFLAPVLFRSDVVIYGLDTLTEEYPMYWWGWTQVKETGQVPWWCPHLFGGYPFVASFSFCPFYPPQWLSLLMEFPAAYNWQFFLVLWMAGCCGYAGLRQAGWPRGLSLVGGLLWMTCGHVVTLIYPGHLKKMQALVWVPLVWGGVAGALRLIANPDLIPSLKSSGSILRFFYFFKLPAGMFAIAGVAMAMQLLAHHFQIFYFTVMMVGLYWLWIAAMGEGDENIPRGRRRKILFKGGLIGLIGAGLVAVGLSAVQMFPSMHMAALSNRAGGVSFEEATITSYPPEELLEFALPQFWGDSVRRQYNDAGVYSYDMKCWWEFILPLGFKDIPSKGTYLGRWNSRNPERLVSDYIGIIAILFTGIGLFFPRRRERWFWLMMIMGIALIAIGSYTPLFKLFWRFTPLINKFRSPGTSMFVMSWGLIMMCLMGFEVLLEKMKKAEVWNLISKSTKLTVLSSSIIILICTVIAYANIDVLANTHNSEIFFISLKWLIETSSIGRSAIIFFLLSISVFIAVKYILGNPKLKPYSGLIVISVIVFIHVIDLWDHTRPFVQPEPYTAGYARYLFDTPPDNFLATQPQPFRMIQYNNELATRFLARGLNSTHGLHPITYQKYFDILVHAWFDDSLFIHLYNQQYVIARANEALPEGFEKIGEGGGYQVGKYMDELNHVWLHHAMPTRSDGPVFDEMDMALAEGRFYSTAIVGEADYSRVQSEYESGLFSESSDLPGVAYSSKAKVVQYSPGDIQISIKSSAPAWLILSEHAAPGWFAETQSSVIRPITVNYFFQMYPIQSGEQLIRVRYRQPWAAAGAATSLITMVVLLWLAIRYSRIKKTQFVDELA